MHAYAAADDPEIREATRNGFRRLWLLVERATGLPHEDVVQFFAIGMLINVAASLDLPHLDEPWAQAPHRADLPRHDRRLAPPTAPARVLACAIKLVTNQSLRRTS